MSSPGVLQGREAVKEGAQRLAGGSSTGIVQLAPGIPLKTGLGYSRADASSNGVGATALTAPNRELITTPLSQVVMESVDWLMPRCLAFGKVVMLFGFPGEGKSGITLDIAARGSTGRPMPDGYANYGGPFKTLLISYEDDPADTLKPRLLAAGGDPNRVLVVNGVSHGGEEPNLASLPGDLDLLERELLGDPQIRLVVIDPWMAALEAGIDSHRDQDTRRVTGRLKVIAERLRVCIVIVNHLPKRPGASAVTAASGSIGVMAQARVGLMVDKHPENPEASVLVVAKSNLGAKVGLAFKKVGTQVQAEDGATCETLRIEWLGPVAFSAEDVLSAREEATSVDSGRIKDAAEWLAGALAHGEWAEQRFIAKAGSDNGFSLRSLQRAARQLGAETKREGIGVDHRSYWRLCSATHDTPMELSGRSPLAPVSGRSAVVGGSSATLHEADNEQSDVDPSAPGRWKN